MKGLAWILAGMLALAGCATVAPWQRDVLARPEMRLNQDAPSRSFEEHSVITIEQAVGGEGKSGGGCGCR